MGLRSIPRDTSFTVVASVEGTTFTKPCLDAHGDQTRDLGRKRNWSHDAGLETAGPGPEVDPRRRVRSLESSHTLVLPLTHWLVGAASPYRRLSTLTLGHTRKDTSKELRRRPTTVHFRRGTGRPPVDPAHLEVEDGLPQVYWL